MLWRNAAHRRLIASTRPRCFVNFSTAVSRGRRELRRIRTVIPQNLQPSDFVDVSNITYPYIRVGDSFDGLYYARHQKFPPHSHGFLYFHPSDYPLDPGELRLRVTDSNDPASFEHGKDLLRPEGFAWCIKAATIASQSKPAFRDILLREGLISQHNMERCRKIGLVGMRPTLLYTLGQPFHIDVSTVSTRINFVCGDEKSNIILPYLFYDRRKSYSRHFAPFTGHILARFEFSPLPQHQDNDNPVLVVRILEILSPIECTVKKYDNYIRRPVAGTLHESGMGVYTIPLTKESKKNNRLRSWIESAMQ